MVNHLKRIITVFSQLKLEEERSQPHVVPNLYDFLFLQCSLCFLFNIIYQKKKKTFLKDTILCSSEEHVLERREAEAVPLRVINQVINTIKR